MAKRGQKLRQRSSKKKTHRGKRVTHKIRTRKHAKKRSTRKRRHTFPRLTRTKKLRRMKGGAVEGTPTKTINYLKAKKDVHSKDLSEATTKNYNIQSYVGYGAKGVVFKGTCDTRLTAFKYSLPDEYSQLCREKDIMDALACEYIPTVFDIHQLQDGYGILAMELCPGEELHSLVKTIPAFHIPHIMKEIASAVACIHETHMHLDLKLENIMYDQVSMKLMIIDFGNALPKTAGFSKQVINRVEMGSPNYTDPRMIKIHNSLPGSAHKRPDDGYDGTVADMYSVGCCYFLLMAGWEYVHNTHNINRLIPVKNEEKTPNYPRGNIALLGYRHDVDEFVDDKGKTAGVVIDDILQNLLTEETKRYTASYVRDLLYPVVEAVKAKKAEEEAAAKRAEEEAAAKKAVARPLNWLNGTTWTAEPTGEQYVFTHLSGSSYVIQQNKEPWTTIGNVVLGDIEINGTLNGEPATASIHQEKHNGIMFNVLRWGDSVKWYTTDV